MFSCVCLLFSSLLRSCKAIWQIMCLLLAPCERVVSLPPPCDRRFARCWRSSIGCSWSASKTSITGWTFACSGPESVSRYLFSPHSVSSLANPRKTTNSFTSTIAKAITGPRLILMWAKPGNEVDFDGCSVISTYVSMCPHKCQLSFVLVFMVFGFELVENSCVLNSLRRQ